MWITKGNRMFWKVRFFSVLILLIIIIIIIAQQREEGGLHSFFFVLKWNRPEDVSGQPQLRPGVQSSAAILWPSARNVRPEPKTRAQPSWCSSSGGTRLSCADSAILRSQSQSYLKNKKKTGIFLLLFVALRCHVVTTAASRIHIDLWAGPGGRGWAGRASWSNGWVTDRSVRKHQRQGVCYTVKLYRPKCLSFTTTVVELLLWCFLFNIYVTFRWEILRFCLFVVFFFALFSFIFTIWTGNLL